MIKEWGEGHVHARFIVFCNISVRSPGRNSNDNLFIRKFQVIRAVHLTVHALMHSS